MLVLLVRGKTRHFEKQRLKAKSYSSIIFTILITISNNLVWNRFLRVSKNCRLFFHTWPCSRSKRCRTGLALMHSTQTFCRRPPFTNMVRTLYVLSVFKLRKFKDIVKNEMVCIANESEQVDFLSSGNPTFWIPECGVPFLSDIKQTPQLTQIKIKSRNSLGFWSKLNSKFIAPNLKKWKKNCYIRRRLGKDNISKKCAYHFRWCGRQMVRYQWTLYLPYFASSQSYHWCPEQIRILMCQNCIQRRLQN